MNHLTRTIKYTNKWSEVLLSTNLNLGQHCTELQREHAKSYNIYFCNIDLISFISFISTITANKIYKVIPIKIYIIWYVQCSKKYTIETKKIIACCVGKET